MQTIEATAPRRAPLADSLPPELFFLVSAVFHYLGPSFAVLLFAYVDVLGVAWLRIASAAVIFALWRKPWRRINWADRSWLKAVLAWGVVLGIMNCTFYLAIARLPLGTVAAIEFLPVIVLAALGSRTRRNVAALVLAVVGVFLLTDVVISGDPLGVIFAFANAALFAAYIAIGHRVAEKGASSGIDALATAMIISAVVVTPIAGASAVPALAAPLALLAGIGVGVSSSVIPYITDQLAMARIKRSTYAVMVSILPATAVIIGAIVLQQIPNLIEIAGVCLVVAAVGVHRDKEAL
jgi:inner membrane transporter RhtA